MRIARICLLGTLGAAVPGCGAAEPLDDYSGGVPGTGGAPGSIAIATGGTREPGGPGDRAGQVVSCCMMNEPCIPLSVELCLGTLASVCHAYEGWGEVCGMCDDSGNPDICCCTVVR